MEILTLKTSFDHNLDFIARDLEKGVAYPSKGRVLNLPTSYNLSQIDLSQLVTNCNLALYPSPLFFTLTEEASWYTRKSRLWIKHIWMSIPAPGSKHIWI